jgi:hypothetical protein
MQSLAVLEAAFPVHSSAVQLTGDLKMRQHVPIPQWTARTLYDAEPIDWAQASTSMGDALAAYTDRSGTRRNTICSIIFT